MQRVFHSYFRTLCREGSGLCLTHLVCEISLDFDFAKVNIFPLYHNRKES